MIVQIFCKSRDHSKNFAQQRATCMRASPQKATDQKECSLRERVAEWGASWGALFLSFVLQKSIMGSQVLLKMAAQSGGFVNVIVHFST